jgi:hypothetical protein
MNEFKCSHCQTSFNHRKQNRKFCSSDCFHGWSRGKINKTPKSLDHRKKLSESQKGKLCLTQAFLSPERGHKISDARKGMKFSIEHRQALSEAKVRFLQAGGFHGKQSSYVSVKTKEINWAHSNLELDCMRQLDHDDNVTSWTKNHHVKISYDWRDSKHNYIPDFLITLCDGKRILLETKGYEFEPDRCREKEISAETFCANRGWTYQVIQNCGALKFNGE